VPLGSGERSTASRGQLHQVQLDSWADKPTLWVVGHKRVLSNKVTRKDYGKLVARMTKAEFWLSRGIRSLIFEKGKWKIGVDFAKKVQEKVVRLAPHRHNQQKLFYNPKYNKLYIGEPDSGPTGKAYRQLIVIDPEGKGRGKLLNLPFSALDLVFGMNGMAHLRTTDLIVRYDSVTWKEIPWDYGEEIAKRATSALVMPSAGTVCFHQGGMSVNAKGYLIVACGNRLGTKTDGHVEKIQTYGKPYTPVLYPGRIISSTSCSVHIWDKHGKVVHKDAIAGLLQTDGVFLDAKNDIYVMMTPSRVLNGKRYFNRMSETLVKFKPGRARIVSSKGAPIPLPNPPKKSPQGMRGNGKIWMDGAEWFYGGVGFAGFNGAGCACWRASFQLDYFGRSFAPEPYQYRVAVLDSNGNLILHVGQYGNVDSSGPKSLVPLGGDEVGLFHANYTGIHTDRRLWIADNGNARIVSVKLNYHRTEKISLEDVEDKK